MQILALSREVDLDASQGSQFNVALRTGASQHLLNPREYSALWQLSGARRRRNGFMPPPDEIERTKGKLVQAGLLVPVNVNGVAELGPQHRVSLGEVELQPSLYEVLEGTRRIGFLGAFDALIFNACDGSRDVNALCAWAGEQGYQVGPADVQGALARLSAANLIGAGPGGRPVRRPELAMRLDAVIARPPWGDVGYLLDPDESDVVGRCRGGCTVGELMAAAGTDQDRAWIQSVVARACAIGLTTVSADAGHAAHNFDTDFGDDDGNTVIEAIPTAPVAPPAPAARALPPHPMYPSPSPSPRATPQPMYEAPPSRATPQPMYEAPPTRTTPAAGFQAVQPRMSPSSREMPVARTTPPHAMHAPPTRPSGMTPAPGVPTRAPTSPFGAAGGAFDDPHGGPPVRQSGKLASLASLSLEKDSAPQQTTSAPTRAPSGGSSKLPWILLVLVIGGGAYYIGTVKNQAPAPVPTTTGSGSGTTPPPPVAPRTLIASGYIAARAPILLSPKTAGRLEELKVDSGAQVKKGQLLATMSDGQARSDLTLANAKASDAARQLKLMKELVKAQAATRVDLQKAMGNVELAGAEVRAAKQRLDETKIRSPIDGTVLEVLVRPGEAITGATAGVLRIANLNELVAEMNVGEAELRQVYSQQACEVVSDADRERIHKGLVREIAEQADRSRGTVLVKVELESITDGSLKPGMAVQVKCLPKPAPGETAGDAAGSGATPSATGSAAGSAAGSGSAAAKSPT